MRELPRQSLPVRTHTADGRRPPEALTEADRGEKTTALLAELSRIALLLRTGGEEYAVQDLEGVTLALSGLSAPGAAQELQASWQEALLCKARHDAIGLADVLEHRLMRLLRG